MGGGVATKSATLDQENLSLVSGWSNTLKPKSMPSALAVFACRPNSHPFQERHVYLDEPVKIGRSVARCRPAQNNATFDCKVLSRNHALVWFDHKTGKVRKSDRKVNLNLNCNDRCVVFTFFFVFKMQAQNPAGCKSGRYPLGTSAQMVTSLSFWVIFKLPALLSHASTDSFDMITPWSKCEPCSRSFWFNGVYVKEFKRGPSRRELGG